MIGGVRAVDTFSSRGIDNITLSYLQSNKEHHQAQKAWTAFVRERYLKC